MTRHTIIVGAGICGLFTALELRKKFPGMRITVIEKNDYVGGRIKTEKYSNFILEYGPMRFEPKIQPLFENLLKTLDIKLDTFSPYTSPLPPPDLNKLESEEIQCILPRHSVSNPAFALLKYGLKTILKGVWDLDNDDITDETRNKRKQDMRDNAIYKGKYLYEYGLWDLFSHVLSKEAIEYLQTKGTFYHVISHNPNAADQICFMLDILATSSATLYTIPNGTQTIISKLQDRCYASDIDLLTQCVLQKFTQSSNGISVMINDDMYTCDNLVFTCQRNAYKYIEGFDRHTQRLLDGVMTIDLFKLFIVFDAPPYTKAALPKANFSADKIPCREIHYSINEREDRGCIMLYGEFPSINYWKDVSQNESYLHERIKYYLDVIFPGNSSQILHHSVIDWSDNVHQTGVHLWKSGVQSSKYRAQLLKNGNVYICGEAYSAMQGFIEGSLQTSFDVVNCMV